MLQDGKPTFYTSKSNIPDDFLQYLVDTDEFMSNDLKVVTYNSDRFYHFLLNTMATYLTELENDKSVSLIFMHPSSFKNKDYENMSIDGVVEFYKNKLRESSVKIYTLPVANDLRHNTVIVPIKNVIIRESLTNSETDKLVIDYVRSFSEVSQFWETPRADRTVTYCSRKYTSDSKEVSLDDIRLLKGYKDLRWPRRYPRIDREDLTEDYMRSHSIDLSYPELFDSYEDQMKYYANCKTLISTTSAGLLNMLYMPPRSTVIELYTPIYGGGAGYRETYHDQYRLLSVLCGHNHITIPNTTRSFEEIKSIFGENLWTIQALRGE
jgi:hypothetical protein